MRFKIFPLGVALLMLSSPLQAAPPTPKKPVGAQWFLTAKEINALPYRQRKTYLREVRAVLADVAVKSDLFAAKAKPTREIAAAPTSSPMPPSKPLVTPASTESAKRMALLLGEAEVWRKDQPTGGTTPESQSNYKTSMWWLVAAKLWHKEMPDSDPQKKDFERRLNAMESFYKERRPVLQSAFVQEHPDPKDHEKNDPYIALDKANEGKTSWHAKGSVVPGTLIFHSTKQAVGQTASASPTTSTTQAATTAMKTPVERPEDPIEPGIQRRPRAVSSGLQTVPADSPEAVEPGIQRRPRAVSSGRRTTPASTTPTAAAETPPSDNALGLAPTDNTTAVTPPAAAIKDQIGPATPSADPSSTETTPAETEPRAPELRGYRCMYSGFVIRQDPCKGPQTLPEGFLMKDVGDAFTCTGKKVICNPLLFGVKPVDCSLRLDTAEADARQCIASAKPVCVNRGQYATRDCGKASESDADLETAATVIKLNPEAWNEYLTSFYELCDDKMISFNGFVTHSGGEERPVPEATKRDIEQTCDKARVRLAAIAAKHRDVNINRPTATPATPTAPEAPAAPGTDGQQ